MAESQSRSPMRRPNHATPKTVNTMDVHMTWLMLLLYLAIWYARFIIIRLHNVNERWSRYKNMMYCHTSTVVTAALYDNSIRLPQLDSGISSTNLQHHKHCLLGIIIIIIIIS